MRIGADTICRLRGQAAAGRVVAFDTETTGISRWDEICQIAAVEYVDGVLNRTFSVYIRPTCEMNPAAEAVHGLSMEFLEENGIAPEEAMERFFGFVGSNVLLAAHNSRFDMRMLNQECAKFGLCLAVQGATVCDTLALSRHFRPDMRHHRLADMIDALGLDETNSHDALDDALACGGVLFALLGLPASNGTLAAHRRQTQANVL